MKLQTLIEPPPNTWNMACLAAREASIDAINKPASPRHRHKPMNRPVSGTPSTAPIPPLFHERRVQTLR